MFIKLIYKIFIFLYTMCTKIKVKVHTLISMGKTPKVY